MIANNREDIIALIARLLGDLESNPESWENPTLERYLEAMMAWLEDSKKKWDEPLSWDLVARMLVAASGYE